MHRLYLLLGGNLGNRLRNLKIAREQVGLLIGGIEAVSSVYETEPWGFTHEIPFFNQAIISLTSLQPEKILKVIHEIEEGLGRKREKGHYSARTIDIDILFFDDLIINRKELVIPHPKLHDRRFVLEPLLEIAPGLVHPVFGKTISGLYDACEDDSSVRKTGNSDNL